MRRAAYAACLIVVAVFIGACGDDKKARPPYDLTMNGAARVLHASLIVSQTAIAGYERGTVSRVGCERQLKKLVTSVEDAYQRLGDLTPSASERADHRASYRSLEEAYGLFADPPEATPGAATPSTLVWTDDVRQEFERTYDVATKSGSNERAPYFREAATLAEDASVGCEPRLDATTKDVS